MPFLYDIIIHEIGYKKLYTSYVGDRFYVLSDGTRVRMPTTTAWCSDCRKVVSVEQVPEIAVIQDAINREICLDDEDSIGLFNEETGFSKDEIRMLRQNTLDKERRYYLDVLRWRKARKGLRRCLVCGGHLVRVLRELGNFRTDPPTEKTKINIDGEDFTFEVSWRAHALIRNVEEKLYDTEGNLISAENES